MRMIGSSCKKLTSIFLKSNISGYVLATCRKMSNSNGVILETVGNKGIITLDRPKALHSLNMPMIEKIYPALKEWETSKALVIVKGTGEKAFCAGGDVKSIAEAGLRGDRNLGSEFFRKEYENNALIGRYKIPYIALIHGITMGGGVGLSVHGRYRVATEKTLFAMPETQIGFFPDVGGSYFLSRLQGNLGLFLGLTGYRLKGRDVARAKIATHYCESNNLADLEKELLKCNSDSEVKSVLDKFQTKDDKQFILEPHLKLIEECFSAGTVEDIVRNLQKNGSEFAKEILQLLSKMSPTSLKITKKQLQYGSSLNLNECLEMEYYMAKKILENKDFFEGVRALLIDKDQNPKWNPAKLEEVTEEHIQSYFPVGKTSLLNKL